MAVPKFLKGLRANNQRVTEVADPTAATDAANKQYVDNTAAGLSWKTRVRAASTANVTIASALINGLSMDGVSLVTGDRVLLKNQTTASENGIYIVAASGAAARATDADTSAEIRNLIVGVESGTLAADTIWQLVTDSPTLGSTSLSFTQFVSGGTTYTAGAGLAESPAGTFNVGAGNGITVNADDIQVNTAVVVRKFAADCVVTTNPQTFTHGLGTNDVEVAVWETNDLVFPDVTKGAGTVIVDWGSAPSAAQYRVIIQG